ncbi:MAG TPA: hypothetical protein VMW27_16595 [Thermoanaerobaculia bacterium]|nr:hypothetical protein [Thermoanaerobaculia bacterium]
MMESFHNQEMRLSALNFVMDGAAAVRLPGFFLRPEKKPSIAGQRLQEGSKRPLEDPNASRKLTKASGRFQQLQEDCNRVRKVIKRLWKVPGRAGSFQRLPEGYKAARKLTKRLWELPDAVARR